MRFGLKAKETLAITLLTFLVVATTTLVHLSQLTRITVQDAMDQADLITKQIYAQIGRALSRAPGQDPQESLRLDPELRSLLEASVGYSRNLLYALLIGQTGTAILHSEPGKEGTVIPEQPPLKGLLALDPFRRYSALSRSGKIYEVVLPFSLNKQPFGSIRLGLSTTLLRRELNASLTRALALAGLALPVAWIVAMSLTNLALKPIGRITKEMERLRRGEFEVGGDLAREGEFKELASQLQLLGQQLQSDRLQMLSEKAQLQQVVDQLEDGLIFLSQDRRVLFFNKAAELIVGRRVVEVLGWPVEDLLEPSSPLRPILDSPPGLGVRNATVTLPQDGKTREFLISAFPIGDAQQEMGTMVLLKNLESIRTVQSLVSYSAKLTALGRLTSGLAHEIKNPLNAMAIHLELLKEKLDTRPEGVQQSLAIIEGEIRRLDRVVQGFVKFIRPQELALKPVDLRAHLQGLIALLEAEWGSKGIHFDFQPEKNLPPVRADEELLHQAFLNVLLNACQAMPSGGTITVRTTQDSEGFVRVIIADEGVGIPLEDKDKIFRLYYTTKTGGSGIGLSLVYRIIQQHDGSIDVSSEVGRGTTLTVRLPLGG
ncbi:MAG TPA: ATP-binding protein [Candidatus Acidoferrum sp.]|nr:ATP-binding protein [Candidatus Acidoferrum sp.]